MHPAESGRIERLSALRLYSLGSAWLSNEDDRKGTIEVEKFADLAVLSADYFTIPEEAVKQIESVLTLVGGKVSIWKRGVLTACTATIASQLTLVSCCLWGRITSIHTAVEGSCMRSLSMA